MTPGPSPHRRPRSVWTAGRGQPPRRRADDPYIMWPQSSLEEVRAAQELADAGDPAFTWQVDPGWPTSGSGRYEVRSSPGSSGRSSVGGRSQNGVRREGPERCRRLYRPRSSSGARRAGRTRCTRTRPRAADCAPTIDDVHYERVSVDLPSRPAGRHGIWVVTRWGSTRRSSRPPGGAERRPRTLEDSSTHGSTARRRGGMQVPDPTQRSAPLRHHLRRPLDRFEFERLGGPRWHPRLDDLLGPTVRGRQRDRSRAGDQSERIDGFWLDANSTTENERPIVLSHASGDGQVTASVPTTWRGVFAQEDPADSGLTSDVWFGLRLFGSRDSETSDGGRRVGLRQPGRLRRVECAANEESPLLSAPASAAAITQQVVADPNFKATAPVAARIGEPFGCLAQRRLCARRTRRAG